MRFESFAILPQLDRFWWFQFFSEGYVTAWDISELLESPIDTIPNQDARYELVKQLISWRAHLMKITAIAYVNESRILLTGSADGSVR